MSRSNISCIIIILYRNRTRCYCIIKATTSGRNYHNIPGRVAFLAIICPSINVQFYFFRFARLYIVPLEAHATAKGTNQEWQTLISNYPLSASSGVNRDKDTRSQPYTPFIWKNKIRPIICTRPVPILAILPSIRRAVKSRMGDQSALLDAGRALHLHTVSLCGGGG